MYHVTALRIIDCLVFEMWHSYFGARLVQTRGILDVSGKKCLIVCAISFLFLLCLFCIVCDLRERFLRFEGGCSQVCICLDGCC